MKFSASRLFLVAVFSLLFLARTAAADTPSAAADHVVGHEKCAKCHQPEIDVWKRTLHYETFRQLHRNPKAKEITDHLGLRSIKRNDVCIQCHYTQQRTTRGRIKPIAGVSCESCHGAAAKWLDIHHDYGGPNMTREQESPAHRQHRRRLAIERGMRNPVNLYLVAKSCLACHTTPNEQLVNVGGHPPGSTDFELVRWSQGRLRHNFVRSHGERNHPSAVGRLRIMYVVGMLADLEFSLRATGKATAKAKYGFTNAQRAHRLRVKLRALQQRLDSPYLQQAVEAAFQAKLKVNNQAQLSQAADIVSQAAYEFAQHANGSTLHEIDRFLPDPSDYK